MPLNPTVDRSQLLAQHRGLCALARVLAREDAEDHVQETYVAALASPTSPRSPGPWMRQVLRNGVRDKVRRSRRRRELAHLADAPREAELPENTVAEQEVSRMLREVMEVVGPPYREVIELRFFEDQSTAEIARELNIPAGTIRWRLHEGLERMRRELDERSEGRQTWPGLLLAFAGPPPRSPETVSVSSSGSARSVWAIAGVGVAVASVLALTLAASPERSSASVAEDQGSPGAQASHAQPAKTLHAAAIRPRASDPATAPTPSSSLARASASEVIDEAANPRLEAQKCAQQAIEAYNATPEGTGEQALELLVEAANCSEDAHMIGQSIQINRAIRQRFPDSVHASEANDAIKRLFSRILDADAGLDTEWGRDCVAPLDDERSVQERQAAAQCLNDAGLLASALAMRLALSEDLESAARQANLEFIETLEASVASYAEVQSKYLSDENEG